MTSPFAPISELARDIRERRLSPVALAEQCLSRIEALNPGLNAFITVTSDLAREQAAKVDREIAAGRWRGPLHGIPVAVKDFYDTAGVRTTAGFRQFEHRVPAEDAELVVKLRDAGAVLLGKTNMHRLGMGTTSLESDFGPVVNPWSANHVAGGSSGGSCVALAAGLCFATVDTDAVGSGRLPAAICGVSCHKPTFGTLSATGVLAGERTEPAILKLSHPCVTARSVDDVSPVFEALTTARVDRESGGQVSPGLVPIRRIGVVTNFKANDEMRAAFQRMVAPLATMDIATREVRVPFESATFDNQRDRRGSSGDRRVAFRRPRCDHPAHADRATAPDRRRASVRKPGRCARQHVLLQLLRPAGDERVGGTCRRRGWMFNPVDSRVRIVGSSTTHPHPTCHRSSPSCLVPRS